MAGPACFLSEDLYHLNFAKYSIFPAQDHFYEYAKLKGYENETIILLPEDELSACNKCLKKLTQKNLLNECFTDKKNYLEQYIQSSKRKICSFH